MNKVYMFFQKYTFLIIISIVGLAYVLTGASNIIKTEETVGSIIASSILGTVLGWLISSLFGKQAIQNAFSSPEFVNAVNTLGQEIETIDKYNDQLDVFCDIENEDTMIRKRTRILKRANISYEDYEKNTYNYALTEMHRKAIKKANKIGYGFLTSDWLLSDIEQEEEKDDKPINLTAYQIKKDASNLATKILTGVVGGLYILEPFANANANIIIWRLFFFALWLIFGYVRYVGDYNFIVRDYRKQITKKTNHIIKFRNSLTKNPDWYIEKPKVVEDVCEDSEKKVLKTTEEPKKEEYKSIFEMINQTPSSV